MSGKVTPTVNKISGTFTETGTSAKIPCLRKFNVSLYGTWSGTVSLERSFDAGATWETRATYTTNTSTILEEVEVNVFYRFNCTTYTSGTVNYRIGAPGLGS